MSKLVSPHGGGGLEPRLIGAADRAEAMRWAASLPAVPMTSRETSDLVRLAIGGSLSPRTANTPAPAKLDLDARLVLGVLTSETAPLFSVRCGLLSSSISCLSLPHTRSACPLCCSATLRLQITAGAGIRENRAISARLIHMHHRREVRIDHYEIPIGCDRNAKR